MHEQQTKRVTQKDLRGEKHMLQQMKSARGRGITVDTIRATMVAGRSLAWKVAAVALPAAVAFAGLAAVSVGRAVSVPVYLSGRELELR